jgi:hypothetical protein
MAKVATSNRLEKTDLLWVNQDEKTLSKNKHINKNLRAHIMHDYARKKTFQGIQRIKKDMTALDSFMGRNPSKPKEITVSTAEIRTSEVDVPFRTQQKPVNQAQLAGIPTEATEVDARLIPSSENIVAVFKPPTPTAYLNGGAGDPFFSSAVRMDAFTHGLIQYYNGVLLPALYAREGGGVRIKNSTELQKFLSDGGEMFAILAMSSSHQESLRRATGTPDWQLAPRERTSLYYKIKTIQTIQKNLTAAPHDIQQSVIRAMSRLSYAESVSGNFQAQLVHQRAMYRLIDMRGGLDTIDEPWPESIIMTDIKSSIVMLGQPYFALTWSPPDLPRETARKIIPRSNAELMSLGIRLFDPSLPSSTVFHPAVNAIFHDLRQVVHMAEYAGSHINSMEWSELKWMTVKTLAVEHRLLSLAYDPVLQSETPDPRIQSCVRIATIIYTNITLLNNIPIEILRYLVPQLKYAFSQTDLNAFWAPFADILLWVLCIGAHLAETTPDEEWFLEHMTRTAEFLLIREWTEVSSLLRGFFYLKRMHEAPLERMWRKVQMKMDAGKAEDGAVAESLVSGIIELT